MAITYKFASNGTTGLFAFTGDRTGATLPEKHGPWLSKGTVKLDKAIPRKTDRETAESAIAELGYQMWRVKKRAN